jgi:3-hydroxymyristoyl/3-hydroxydecanoyl-(acyl carrier protein) dehydratase
VLRPGPKLNRRELEEIATMKRSIASVFGPLFERQKNHRYQLRLPAPPMTIVDRVTGIEGEPGSVAPGRLWSETDVTADCWWLDPAGYMSTFALCESGQANMLLASWLGMDLLHEGLHRYRLIDLDHCLNGPVPAVGETVAVELILERAATVGGIRLFFFSVNVRVGDDLRSLTRFTAGLFTEEQLALPGEIRGPKVLEGVTPQGPLDLKPEFVAARSFSREAMQALAEGRLFECFGAGFERLAAHVRTPRAALKALSLLDEVQVFDPLGGPWKRGYLRATQRISADEWYFQAHLPGDPCLPGFLLSEAAVQAMSFYMTALGMTLRRDGWRFEILRNHRLACKFRGQVTPCDATLVHEIFVESIAEGPEPRIIADVVSSIDGRVIFQSRRAGISLRLDWPLEQFRRNPWSEKVQGDAGPMPVLGGLAGYRNEGSAAVVIEGQVENDYRALLATCWGKATDVFGSRVALYDEPTRCCRLPGPPFLFVTRVTRKQGDLWEPRAGSWMESEYDVPENAWYFSENGYPVMPFAVLLEAMLQPCGWLMYYVSPPRNLIGAYLRNLDGTITVFEEVLRGRTRLDVRAELVTMSELGGTRICTHEVQCYCEGRLIAEMRTTFGSFPPEALAQQAGVAVTAKEQERIESPGGFYWDLSAAQPERFFSGTARLAAPMLRMIGCVTAFDRAGGEAGLGWLRAEKDVDPGEWFFKAHFYLDPVQPGSLGLEALLQLLQLYMIEEGLAEGIPGARFEPIAIDRKFAWKYRGQVVPENKHIVTEIEITGKGRDNRGSFAVANGWLWVDGIRVYHAVDLGMRMVPGKQTA